MMFEPLEQRGVGDQSVLDDLCESRAQLARRQRGERGRVGDHESGLVERANQVLAAGVVDAGLAADGRVDLGEQRRRQLHEVDSALVAGRRKAGEIAHHSAAEREHRAIAR